MSKVVLITGCSTGIGRDLAQRLTKAGYCVVATSRKADALEGMNVALKLTLDVTRPESVHQAVERVIQRFGCIDVLVNNAGYAQCGAIEDVSDEQIQHMFDVNVFGAMRMVRAIVPHMRQQGSGRIINISSIAGKLVTPVNGTYSATKFALEAMSDALRLELAPFGIQVVLIEPGAIKTNFEHTVQAHAQRIFSNPGSPYQALYRKYQQFSDSMRKNECGPEVVSQAVQQAMETRRPKARYLVAFPFSGRLVLRMGEPAWDLIVKQIYRTA